MFHAPQNYESRPHSNLRVSVSIYFVKYDVGHNIMYSKTSFISFVLLFDQCVITSIVQTYKFTELIDAHNHMRLPKRYVVGLYVGNAIFSECGEGGMLNRTKSPLSLFYPPPSYKSISCDPSQGNFPVPTETCQWNQPT